MKRYLSRIFAVLILAILVSACAGGTGSTVTDEPAAESTAEPAQEPEMPEEAAELSLTLHSQDAPEAEQTFHTSNRETIEAFHDLFECVKRQREYPSAYTDSAGRQPVSFAAGSPD